MFGPADPVTMINIFSSNLLLVLLFFLANRRSGVAAEFLALKLRCWMLMVAGPVFRCSGLLWIYANIYAFTLRCFPLLLILVLSGSLRWLPTKSWEIDETVIDRSLAIRHRCSKSCPLGTRLQSVWQFEQSLLIVDDMKVIDVGPHLWAALLGDAVSWRERKSFTSKQQLNSTECCKTAITTISSYLHITQRK